MSEAPVAAIDCGTNTIKLFIGTPPEALVREARMVRLGQGVDATGRLSDEALQRTFAALDEYAALVRQHDVPPERIRFCATSATRDAANASVFRDAVVERLGVAPEVLSGDEEAALAFAGAMSGLPDDVVTPVLVVDVGGGSTEVVLGSRGSPRSHLNHRIVAARSMDVGSVRLHERHVRHDPPTPAEVAAIRADVDAALDACDVPLTQAATVVGIAGTCTTLGAALLDLPAYDREAIDGTVHDVTAVRATVEALVGLTVAQRTALGFMHPGRADVIDAGVLVVERVLARTGATSLRVCESDILDGIAASIG